MSVCAKRLQKRTRDKDRFKKACGGQLGFLSLFSSSLSVSILIPCCRMALGSSAEVKRNDGLALLVVVTTVAGYVAQRHWLTHVVPTVWYADEAALEHTIADLRTKEAAPTNAMNDALARRALLTRERLHHEKTLAALRAQRAEWEWLRGLSLSRLVSLAISSASSSPTPSPPSSAPARQGKKPLTAVDTTLHSGGVREVVELVIAVTQQRCPFWIAEAVESVALCLAFNLPYLFSALLRYGGLVGVLVWYGNPPAVLAIPAGLWSATLNRLDRVLGALLLFVPGPSENVHQAVMDVPSEALSVVFLCSLASWIVLCHVTLWFTVRVMW